MLSLAELGRELRRVRSVRGLSLRHVQTETEVSAATLSRIERGSTPELRVAERLAEWLGVDICAARATGAAKRIDSDAEFRRAIERYLRENRRAPEEVAHAVADALELVIALELERRSGRSKRKRQRPGAARGRPGRQ